MRRARGTTRPGAAASVRGAIPLTRKVHAMAGTILIVILILVLVAALPTWNHSRSWGYAPAAPSVSSS